MRFSVIHGANLNLLGEREPEIYGHDTLADIDMMLTAEAQRLGVQLDLYQSNSEGELVDRIQAARDRCDGFIINAGGYTHTSVVIRDALLSVGLPIVEVHLSNPHAREPFRHGSLMEDIAVARIVGFGAIGYRLALEGLIAILRTANRR